MLPIYEKHQKTLKIFHRKSRHVSPHLHDSIECVYITSGTLELGIGQEFYHMEKGDFAIIFPELIHHYQVFDSGKCTATHIMISSSLGGSYINTLQQYCPQNPVIKAENLHNDVLYALKSLSKHCFCAEQHTLYLAYTQIILARCLPLFQLVEKETVGSNDIIYRTVSYISQHFRETVTLTKMASDLGYSPYVLSRVFSNTFHRNFNQYLNDVRNEYACTLLIYTNMSITEIYENAGFESQRTFNRVFKDSYRMSPREYRNKYQGIETEEV